MQGQGRPSLILHKELSYPTAIDHTLKANLTGTNDTNLVVVKGNVLEIFTLDPSVKTSKVAYSPTLKRVGEYPLFGDVACIR